MPITLVVLVDRRPTKRGQLKLANVLGPKRQLRRGGQTRRWPWLLSLRSTSTGEANDAGGSSEPEGQARRRGEARR